MNNIGISFIITLLAGLSTLIGYLVIFLKINHEKLIVFSLALSSSVMLIISFIDLIPSAFNYLSNYNYFYKCLVLAFSLILGIVISFLLNYKIKVGSNSLKKIGLVSLIAIILHNIPEGIITFMIGGINIHLGLELALGISLHNIPEGISIAIPLYFGTNKKINTFIIVLIAGMSEVLGAFLGYVFLHDYITNTFIALILAFVSGIMLNLSISELLPEAYSYHRIKELYLGLVIGLILMIISHLL